MSSFDPAVHVPGVFRCAKCGFQVIQSTLNAHSGAVTARDAVGEKCPNDGSPMWRVTWKEHAEAGWAFAEEAFERGREAGLRTTDGAPSETGEGRL